MLIKKTSFILLASLRALYYVWRTRSDNW